MSHVCESYKRRRSYSKATSFKAKPGTHNPFSRYPVNQHATIEIDLPDQQMVQSQVDSDAIERHNGGYHLIQEVEHPPANNSNFSTSTRAAPMETAALECLSFDNMGEEGEEVNRSAANVRERKRMCSINDAFAVRHYIGHTRIAYARTRKRASKR
ncbi:MAG: helix-loop-helix domain-containing protein [Gammaproteobacteria bacterium]|nr:helix-loop-helix domain-containing protein [Gammaproteobacteria bacterium]